MIKLLEYVIERNFYVALYDYRVLNVITFLLQDVESKILFYEICVPCIKSLHAEGLPVLSLLFYLCFTSLCRYSFVSVMITIVSFI